MLSELPLPPLGGSGSSVTPVARVLSEAHLANRTAGSFQYRLLLDALMAAEMLPVNRAVSLQVLFISLPFSSGSPRGPLHIAAF